MNYQESVDCAPSLASEKQVANTGLSGAHLLTGVSVLEMNLKDPQSLGERIQFWRKKRQMTLEQLASRSGFSPGALSDIEHGRVIKSKHLPEIAIALDISYQFLLTGNGTPEESEVINPPPALSTRLRDAMRQANMTQAELARAVGVSHVAVGKWCSGSSVSLTADNLIAAALALQVDPEWLRTGIGGTPTYAPLPGIPRERLEALTEIERGYLQSKIFEALETIEAHRRASSTEKVTK